MPNPEPHCRLEPGLQAALNFLGDALRFFCVWQNSDPATRPCADAYMTTAPIPPLFQREIRPTAGRIRGDSKVRFSFADHTLDTDRRELRRGAEPIAVEPQ